MGVWWIVGLSLATVLGAILIFRLHAFLTLLLAGLLVAALTSGQMLQSYADSQIVAKKMTPTAAAKLVQTPAPERLTKAFGETAGKIGILIALASIIGQCLLESGAARAIIDRMLAMVGPKRAPEALAASSFVLGIPVFFDTVFYLMVPLARSLRRTVGKNYVLFIMAILAGGSLAHSLIPPTPGPLLVAEEFKVDIGVMLIAGMGICCCSSVVALIAARIINHFVYVPLRFTVDGDAIAATPENDAREREEAAAQIKSIESTESRDAESATKSNADNHGASPSFFASMMPIAIPVVLITIGSVVSYFSKSSLAESTAELRKGKAAIVAEIESTPPENTDQLKSLEAKAADFTAKIDAEKVKSKSGATGIFLALGNKNIAIAIGAALALLLIRYVQTDKRKTLVTRSLASAGNIILITAAGGAFGAMLRQAGIASAVSDLVGDGSGFVLLPLAFLVTASVRTLQGSATVAMITAAGILSDLSNVAGLPFHPVYICMAIGAGSKPISWMTDSAFWVITKMSGMTEGEGLKTLPAMSTSMGISALVFTMLFAYLFPGV